jgi:2-polyprenyl-6-methoxyphenol hydroxylase-like FAD-dependent oxidoreductase
LLRVDTIPQQYNVSGRMASLAADPRDPRRASALVVFASPRLNYDWHDIDHHKASIAGALVGLRWHVPHLLATLRSASDVYFDSICRVSMHSWSAGRVALLGDSSWGVTLGGMGVGTSIVGAYVLAGELAASGGAHHAAFAAYGQRMRPYASRRQRGANPGAFLAPRTTVTLWRRNTLFKSGQIQRWLVAGTRSLATNDKVPEYGTPPDVQDTSLMQKPPRPRFETAADPMR